MTELKRVGKRAQQAHLRWIEGSSAAERSHMLWVKSRGMGRYVAAGAQALLTRWRLQSLRFPLSSGGCHHQPFGAGHVAPCVGAISCAPPVLPVVRCLLPVLSYRDKCRRTACLFWHFPLEI